MKNATINTSTFEFLTKLEKNNNKAWFLENKEHYNSSQENVIKFIDQLLILMSKHDLLENESGKKSLYRIYKDVRFSKDKTPYNSHFSFGFRRATALRRGGYYFKLKPGNSFLACGFFSPNSEDLKRIRKDIDINFEEWHIFLDEIKANFSEIQGELVPTFPRGFDKNHPEIDLIRHKQFILKYNFSDEEVFAPNFVEKVNDVFKSTRPFLDYLSFVLTSDSNGEITI